MIIPATPAKPDKLLVPERFSCQTTSLLMKTGVLWQNSTMICQRNNWELSESTETLPCWLLSVISGSPEILKLKHTFGKYDQLHLNVNFVLLVKECKLSKQGYHIIFASYYYFVFVLKFSWNQWNNCGKRNQVKIKAFPWWSGVMWKSLPSLIRVLPYQQDLPATLLLDR